MANQYVVSAAKSAQNFLNTLMNQQQVQFSGQQEALDAITKAWAPVLQTGVIPYGYSAGLDALLKANVIDTGTQATVNAANASLLRQKQETGGANVLPTGAQEQINAMIQAKGQQEIARGLQAEKIAGYEQGVKNLEGATNAELGMARIRAPGEAAGAATAAGELEEKSGAEMFKENQEDSIFSHVMQGLGAVGGFAKDIFGGGKDSAAAGMGI